MKLELCHRPVVYPPTGSMAYEREMSTPAYTTVRSVAPLHLYLIQQTGVQLSPE